MSKYVVKSGDTLSGIAARHGTTWQEIYNANKSVIGSDPGLIRAGQTLSLGGGSSGSAKSSSGSAPGLSSQAQKYQQVTNELKQYETDTASGLTQYKSDREALYAEQRAAGEEIIDKGVQQQIDSYEHEQAKMDKDLDAQSRAQYVQYEKQMNPYGMQEEAIQEMGLARSGFAETTRARAFNAYQVAVSNMWEKTQEIAADFNIKMNEARAQGDIQRAQLLIQENDRRLADIEYENAMQQRISEIRLQIAESERNFRYQVEHDQRMYELQQQQLALQREIAEWDKMYKNQQLAISRSAASNTASSSSIIEDWLNQESKKDTRKETKKPSEIKYTMSVPKGYELIKSTYDGKSGKTIDVLQKKTKNGSSQIVRVRV